MMVVDWHILIVCVMISRYFCDCKYFAQVVLLTYYAVESISKGTSVM